MLSFFFANAVSKINQSKYKSMKLCSGSRVDKHWFIVRDSSVKTERLLTLVPKSVNCPIQCDTDTRNSVLDLFLALQHPYIYPVLDLEFRDSASGSQTFVVLVLPFNNKGSLKDLIYKVCWFVTLNFWSRLRLNKNMFKVSILIFNLFN